jgi:[ribosomal protein S18]-alanine N-acetyltransferase
MNLIKIHTTSTEYLLILKRMLQDMAGPFLLRRWKQTEKENIASVEDFMLPEILRIQADRFKNGNPEKLIKYSKNSRNIFYVIKNRDKVVGYCTYYLKPTLSLKGFKKQCVICSIATDRIFRDKGFAERLLNESIEEMKLNGISSIILYVNINNQPAIQLYKKIGFREVKTVKNVCSHTEICYEMELELV